MRYLYACPRGHHVEITRRANESHGLVECPHHSGFNTPEVCSRDMYAELQTIAVMCDDPIRRAYNGAKIQHNLAEQGRPLDPLAPRDKFEAKHVEKATGRIYIGESREGLSKRSLKALEKGDRKEYPYQR